MFSPQYKLGLIRSSVPSHFAQAQRRISVSDLMQTYCKVLDLHHIKTPKEGLFFVQRGSQITLEWKVIS